MTLAIEARDLSKVYPPGVSALDGVSLSVTPGTIFALLGPNGAGKSTTVRVLTTLTRPDGGVQWQALSAAACAFLDACEQGLSLERAVGRALEVDTDTPVEMMLGGLLQAGALCVERSTHPLK